MLYIFPQISPPKKTAATSPSHHCKSHYCAAFFLAFLATVEETRFAAAAGFFATHMARFFFTVETTRFPAAGFFFTLLPFFVSDTGREAVSSGMRCCKAGSFCTSDTVGNA